MQFTVKPIDEMTHDILLKGEWEINGRICDSSCKRGAVWTF